VSVFRFSPTINKRTLLIRVFILTCDV
jgi:hypothetical protein